MAQNYYPVTDREQLVVAFLTLAQDLSGTYPTVAEFYASLDQLQIEPTPEFLTTIARLFPQLGLRPDGRD